MATKGRVLVVDDDESVRKSTMRYLRAFGYEIAVASSAEEAAGYRDEKFDIAIIDGLEGKCFEVYAMINAERKAILSADDDMIKQALKRGMEAYPKRMGLGEALRRLQE